VIQTINTVAVRSQAVFIVAVRMQEVALSPEGALSPGAALLPGVALLPEADAVGNK
jgi:hypothetical protein